jgi:hypothetical protein
MVNRLQARGAAPFEQYCESLQAKARLLEAQARANQDRELSEAYKLGRELEGLRAERCGRIDAAAAFFGGIVLGFLLVAGMTAMAHAGRGESWHWPEAAMAGYVAGSVVTACIARALARVRRFRAKQEAE